MLWPDRQKRLDSVLRRLRRLRSGVGQPATAKLVSMAIIDLLQFQALLVGEIRSHFPMCAHYDLMGSPGSVSSHSFELHRCFIDDWRAHEVIVGAHREMAANLTDEQRLKLQQIDDRHRHQLRGRRLADPTPEPSESP